MILEKMLNGPLTTEQLARIINVDITERHLSGAIRVAETYEPTKYWDLDFASQTATSQSGQIKCIADMHAEALLRFYKSAGTFIDFWESRKEYVKVDGGYIDVDTLKTVWPIPGRETEYFFLSNGLAIVK